MTAVPKLGQRLIDGEAWACLGRVIARGLPAYQAMQVQLQTLEQEVGVVPTPGPAIPQTLDLMRARLDTVFDDLSHLWSDPTGEWDRLDVTPGLQRAWRLATMGLPAEVTTQEFAPLPPVWGSEAKLTLAVLYLWLLPWIWCRRPESLVLRRRPAGRGGASDCLGFRGPALGGGVPKVVKSVRRSGPDSGKPGTGPGRGHRFSAWR